MKKVILFVVWILPIFSCVKTDFVNDRVDPKIFISNPLLELKKMVQAINFRLTTLIMLEKRLKIQMLAGPAIILLY